MIASSWPIDALVEPLLHVNQLLDFAFHQPAHRDVRPLGDDFGDVLLVDFFLQHALRLLQLGEPPSSSCESLRSSSGMRPYCSSDALA